MTVPLNVPAHVIEELAMDPAVSRASSMAPSAVQRSPSAIPAMEIDEVASKEEQTTSERYRTLLPSIEETLSTHVPMSSQKSVAGGTDYGAILVAVPFLGHQRDQYQSCPEFAEHAPGYTASKDAQEAILMQMRDIAIHPDLVNCEALDDKSDTSLADQLDWNTQCSSKFRWLREFLRLLRHVDIHIGLWIGSKSGTLILSKFVEALGLFQGEDTEGSSSLRTTIITPNTSLETINCIITIDPQHTMDAGSMPHFVLVVPYSIEHIDISVMPGQDYYPKYQLMKALLQEAGRLDGDMADVTASTRLLAASLTREDSTASPRPAIEQLRLLDFASILPVNGHEQHAKRPLDNSDGDSMPAKRLKSEEDVPSTNGQQGVMQALSAERERRAELEVNLEELQYRFEDMHKQLSEVVKERDAAIKTAQQAVKRMNDQTDNLRNIKTTMSQLRDQLTDCESRLASHAIPETAELERLRQTVAKAEENEQKATAKLDGLRKDMNYAQSLYQDASTKAQALAGENMTLTQQLGVAEAAASSERARLRQTGYDSVAKNLHRENQQLHATIDMRELALASRDEEIARLKDSNRGRMGTRGTSVPRSPRMHSPMKMVDVRITSSRHGSPSAGDARVRSHPLRQS